MEFRILGPLEVSENGRSVEIGGPKQRALLAALLLHANEVVSADRLIDELWGETPPPTAGKTLQAHVSRLRRSLSGAQLETRGRGYRLAVAPGQLDADRFRASLEAARRALADGQPARAAEQARRALELWRGPALADLAYEPFTHVEIARLEELRLCAEEERVEADLALGRHQALVGELEALLSAHPLRERLRGQLMLALYRSDRHAEALQTYQQARQALAEELGLTPGPALQRLQHQILEHDRALAAPAQPAVRSRRRRLRWALIGIGVVAAAAAVGATIVQLEPDEGSAAGESGTYRSRVGVLDPVSGELESAIPLGTTPANVVVGNGGVWVLDAQDRTVSRIDPHRRVLVRSLGLGATPTSLAAGAGAIWVGTGTNSSYPSHISRIDPASGVVDATIALPGSKARGYFQGGGSDQQLIAATDDAVWVINPDQTLARIEPRTNRVVNTVAGIRAATAVAAGAGAVWVIDEQSEMPRLVQIDPATDKVARRIEIAAASLTSLAVGAGAVWLADPVGGSVWRVDTAKHLLRTIPAGVGVRWVAFGAGAVWATNDVADTVHRIDPRTNQPSTRRLPAPGGVAVGEGQVWVTSAGRPPADATLPSSACGPVEYAGPGRPRVLVVSDLPLQGGVREHTRPMVDSIRLVLERRGFRAGRHSVGFQACDDATAQAGGFDFRRCLSNARAYARTPDVLGVIGTYNYGCSEIQIPIANQALDGPLAMISPANTPSHLTRPGWGDDDDLERLYPSRVRNFVRIAAADHLQAPALVQAAKELGAARLAVLHDGDDEPYGTRFVHEVQTAATRLGLDVRDAGVWEPRARGFDRTARRVAATRPDAVLLIGAAPSHVDALLRDLRTRVGRRVEMIASDGFVGVAGRWADGLYIGNYGIPNAALPPAGKRLLAQLDRPGPDFAAAYGAQAAEILLDAIARSDGTRASVARELFRTRVRDGILGDVSFDRFGDLNEGPITIFRVTGNRTVVDRVVTVQG